MPSGTANNAVTTTSSNWSGDAVSNPNKPFTVEAIIGTFVVPTALQAFGSCTGGWDYSALWTGIDGFNSADVLQAGVEVDAYCSGGQAKSFYSAWIEWYPNSSTRVSFPINPGDLVLVEVWNTSPTNGYAYFHNYSTGQVVEYQLTAPLGTSLVGNSVEWIVERPTVFGGLATLTNYIDSAWPNGIALNYQAATPTYQYQGQTPAAGTLNVITRSITTATAYRPRQSRTQTFCGSGISGRRLTRPKTNEQGAEKKFPMPCFVLYAVRWRGFFCALSDFGEAQIQKVSMLEMPAYFCGTCPKTTRKLLLRSMNARARRQQGPKNRRRR
jgi:Peptidase A4 family